MSHSKFYTRTIQYLGVDYIGDKLSKLEPVGTLETYKDGAVVSSVSKPLGFYQIDREVGPGMEPRMTETRATMLAAGKIRLPGDGQPCLALTEADWIRAERILAGLDSGELDLIMSASEDGGPDADTEMGNGP